MSESIPGKNRRAIAAVAYSDLTSRVGYLPRVTSNLLPRPAVHFEMQADARVIAPKPVSVRHSLAVSCGWSVNQRTNTSSVNLRTNAVQRRFNYVEFFVYAESLERETLDFVNSLEQHRRAGAMARSMRSQHKECCRTFPCMHTGNVTH